MWSDIETFLLSVSAETKKFLTIKCLESCNGSYIYVDIRVYNQRGPTVNGLCLHKSEFIIVGDALADDYPFKEPVFYSGRNNMVIFPLGDGGVKITVSKPLYKREVSLTAGEVDHIKRVWPLLKNDLLTKFTDCGPQFVYVQQPYNTLESKDEDLYLVKSINMASNGIVNNKPTVSDDHIVEPTGQTGVVENAPIVEPVVKPKRQYNRRKPLNK
jgi:hypothetical protein